MKVSTIFTTLAATIPAVTATAFGGIAISSGSSIHLSAINATGSTFWIGRPTYTYCPTDVVASCPEGRYTYFLGGNGTLSLSAEVPGGQQVYVSADGALGYTVPHSGDVPLNASTTGFALVDNGLHLQWKGNDFYAVPVGNASRIYAAAAPGAPKNGTGFAFRVVESNVTYEAWEY